MRSSLKDGDAAPNFPLGAAFALVKKRADILFEIGELERKSTGCAPSFAVPGVENRSLKIKGIAPIWKTARAAERRLG
jgi:hypothetical protein